jgi:hypothetical protein
MGVWYATREQLKDALDFKGTSVNDEQIDRALEDSSRSVEGLLNRTFAPTIATRKFDYPNWQYTRAWTLYLDQNELISVTTITSGGIVIPAANYFLEPNDSGPPYSSISLDLSKVSAFTANAGTFQQSISVTGLYGYRDDRASDGTTLTADITSSATSANVSSSARIGVGSLLIIDSERMTVTDRSLLSTGQTLQTPVGATLPEQTIAVTSGAVFSKREWITLDAETMKIVDIAGNNLIVKRAWNGSTLAAHSGSTIYAPRTLTLTRAALGTTGASHTSGTAVARQTFAPHALALAEAINLVEQEQSGLARTIGSGDNVRNASGAGLADLRARTSRAYGRNARVWTP